MGTVVSLGRTMSDTIHVLLADDHDLARAGLRLALRGYEDFSVVGEARDGSEAVRQAKRLRPELVVLDVRMPNLNGIEACREIGSGVPEANILMLTLFADEQAVTSAIGAGASGFMLKGVPPAELIAAMRMTGRGGNVLDPVSAAAVIKQIRTARVMGGEDQLVEQLSEPERKILELIGDGMPDRDIGKQLHLSEASVNQHVSDVLRKLGLSRRMEAAAFAIRRALEKPPND